MPSDDIRSKPQSNLKLWLALIGVVGSTVAIVPPTITALKASPTVSQGGLGNSAIIGSTVSSNNQTTNNYWAMWVEGARTIVGAAPKSQAPALPAAVTPTPPSASPVLASAPVIPEPKDPEPGAIGRLVVNASLINDATWSPEQSRVTRLLTFNFHTEATGIEEKPGSVDATLTREGKDVCTISLNNKTSPLSGGVRWSDSTCYDTLPANVAVTYKARVKSVEMSPLVVRLNHVDAVRK